MIKKIMVAVVVLLLLVVGLHGYNFLRSQSLGERLIPLIASGQITPESFGGMSIVHLGSATASKLQEVSGDFSDQTRVRVTYFDYLSKETNSIVFYNEEAELIGLRLKYGLFSPEVHILGFWTTGLNSGVRSEL